MSKHLFHLRDIGHSGVWRILHGAHDRTEPAHEGMKGASVPLWFAEAAPLERLILTLSIRDMGGSEIYFGPGEWPDGMPENSAFDHIAPARVVSGLALSALEAHAAASGGCPLLNGGGPDAHPCLLLADMALMREERPDPVGTRIAWVGGADGLAHSLIEAAMYIPFELFMALPEWGEPDRELLSLAFAAGAKIFLTRDVHMAVDGAHYVYAGSGPKKGAPDAEMPINGAVMDMAGPSARWLPGRETRRQASDEAFAARAVPEHERFAMRLKVQRLIWNLLLRGDVA